MSYGQTHTETIPTVGVTEGDDYARMVNDVLTEMRATLDAKVTPAGMDMNADLSLRSGATYYGLKDVHRLSLTTQAALLSAATYPTAVYTNSDGNLYYNDASGNQIALTSGGTIAGSAGSISGAGYGSSGVEVNWDSGASDYHFYSGTGTYADVKAANVLLNDGDTNFIRLDAPALSADYTVTWPAALPAAVTSLLSITTAGAMSYTATPTVTSLTTTGALSVGTTTTFTGKATFGVEYAHPQRTRHVTPMEMASDETNFVHTSENPHQQFDSGAGGWLFCPLRLEEGERLEQIVVWLTTSATAGNRTLKIGYWNDTTGAWTYPGGAYTTTSSLATSTRQAFTLNLTDITVTNPSGAGATVGFLMLAIGGVIGDDIWGARVQYSRV